jgi:hypothetical protein
MKKKTIISLLLILTMVLIVSCGPTLRVSCDYDRSVDFSSYKTFGVYNLTTTFNVNQLNAERIWNSVRTEMTKKGYAENKNSPDLMVNVVSVLQEKKYISATNNGWYKPYNSWASGNIAFQAYDYKDGSLIIDVVDIKANRLVWEGKGNAEIIKQPKNPDEVISDAVAKIMDAFPSINSK